MREALYLYAFLAAGLLVLTGLLAFWALLGGGDKAVASVLVAATLTSFAAALSKMGEAVRALNGQKIADVSIIDDGSGG